MLILIRETSMTLQNNQQQKEDVVKTIVETYHVARFFLVVLSEFSVDKLQITFIVLLLYSLLCYYT